jgi:hypothetical protein
MVRTAVWCIGSPAHCKFVGSTYNHVTLEHQHERRPSWPLASIVLICTVAASHEHPATRAATAHTVNIICHAVLWYAYGIAAMLCCYAMLMLCYAMLCYAMLCYAMPRHAMLCCTYYASILCYINYVLLLCSIGAGAMPCHAGCHVTLALRYAAPCYAITLRYATRHAMPLALCWRYYATLRYAALRYATLRLRHANMLLAPYMLRLRYATRPPCQLR